MNFNPSRRDSLKKIAAGAGALALPSAALAQAQGGSGPIRIACIYPLTGPASQNGIANLTGAQIAAAEFNRNGGVLGRQVEIVSRDDKNNPSEAALIGREVFGSGIKFVLGGMQTATGMAVAQQLAENNALLIMTGSTLISLTHEGFNPNVFRCQANTRMYQFSIAKVVMENQPNVTKWGAIFPDLEFGTTNWKYLQAGLRKFHKGGQLEFAEPQLHKFGATDFKVQIAALMNSGIEGLHTGMFGADYLTFMGQAKQLGLFNKIKAYIESGQGAQIGPSLGANMPPDNLWTMGPWYYAADPNNKTNQALVKDYKALGKGDVPHDNVWNGHTAMTAMLNAIKAAGAPEPALVRVGLERTSFEAANGPFRFRREDHQALTNLTVLRLGQKKDAPGWQVAKAVTVKAEDVVEPPSPGTAYVES